MIDASKATINKAHKMSTQALRQLYKKLSDDQKLLRGMNDDLCLEDQRMMRACMDVLISRGAWA